jgi:hypothetical protein
MPEYTGAKGGDFFGLKLSFPETKFLTEQLRQFGPRIADKYLQSAMKKSSQPALAALRSITPKGPTGNLRRAVDSKAIVYRNSGTGVLIVGYTKAGKSNARATGGKVKKGKDRAFHAGFLEFGTKERTTKGGSIASSFKTLGAFSFKKGGSPGRVRTAPKYPKAFFKRAPKGEKVRLGRTPILAPVATAYAMSSGSMKNLLAKNLIVAVENASREVAYLMSRAA